MDTKRKNLLYLAGTIAAAALLSPVVTRAQDTSGMTCCGSQHVSAKSTVRAVPAAKGGVQKATVIIDGGYSPSSLSVKAGKPVEITFVRKSASGCDGELVIPALKFRQSLEQGQKAVVKFTPKRGQSIAFECGMSMITGQITVK